MFNLYLFILLFKQPRLVFKFISAKKRLTFLIKECDILFVYPWFHVGGAEKVHYRIAQIANEIGLKCSILITENSKSDAYSEKFKKLGHYLNISFRYDNAKISNKLRSVLIKEINEANNKLIFTSNNRFFYNLINELSSNRIIDLVHAFYPPFEVNNLSYKSVFNKFYKRIFITKQSLLEMQKYYTVSKLSGEDNLQLIYNSPFNKEVEPLSETVKQFSGGFEVLFVSRNSFEKRPEIAFNIARKIVKKYPGMFLFKMIGDFDSYKNISDSDIEIITHLKDAEEIVPIYKQAHAIILTSETEGFPMVLSEAMFYNVVPISTNVGGIGDVIENNVSGMLIKGDLPIFEIEQAFENNILSLKNNKELYLNMSQSAFNASKNNFSWVNFNEHYTKLFLEAKPIGVKL
jgi:glycosyltransferase involved in cell wall biosynthesis